MPRSESAHRGAPAFESAIVAHRVTVAHPGGGEPLIRGLSLSLGGGLTALVGRNGIGKSSLARVLAGIDEPESGAVHRDGLVAYLPQSLAPRANQAVDEFLGLAGPEGSAARAALRRLLARVRLGHIEPDRPTSSLSGGEFMRLALASRLHGDPGYLILDEPTNNLDALARDALIDLLASLSCGVLVISHDRALLERAGRIVEVTSLGVTTCAGGFTEFERIRAEHEAAAARRLDEAQRAAARAEAETQKALERKQRSDRRGRSNRSSAGLPKVVLNARRDASQRTGGRLGETADRKRERAAGALDSARARVEVLERMEIPVSPVSLPAGRLVFELIDAAFAYPSGPVLFEPVTLRVYGPRRIAITGPNGAGKSTLLRLVTGELRPTGGRIRAAASWKLLDQHLGLLREDEPLVEALQRLNPGLTRHEAHSTLARFVFRGEAALRRLGSLSGGERLRAALAAVLGVPRPPELLILDEPTNHLDLDSRRQLESALRRFGGALVVVSHDPCFLDALAAERIELRRPCV